LQNHYRYIIQGAGASGLWLAHSLNEAGLLAFDQLLIVEGEANKVNDRTWCFWSTEEEQKFSFIDTRSIFKVNDNRFLLISIAMRGVTRSTAGCANP